MRQHHLFIVVPAFILTVLFSTPFSALAATIVADSQADWDAAFAGDNIVEQGHSDTSGQGDWYYRRVDAVSFAQNDLVFDEGLDLFDLANNGSGELPILARDTTHPAAPTTATNRLWNTFLPAGTILRFQGTVADLDGGGGGDDGVLFGIIRNNEVSPPYVNGPVTVTAGNPHNFDFQVTLADNGPTGNFFNFVVSAGLAGNQDFDTTGFSVQVSIVPEPSSICLGGIGLVALCLARRRR